MGATASGPSGAPPAAPGATGGGPARERFGPHLLRMIREGKRTIVFVVGSVAAAVGLFFLLGFAGVYSLQFIYEYLPSGFGPLELSLEFTTFTFLIGMAPAIALALIRAFPPKRVPPPPPRSMDGAPPPKRRRQWGLVWRYPAYAFASGYVAAIRGTPFLVQLFIVYYIIIFSAPHLTFLGWNATYIAGFIALLMNTTGYQAETFRGGFQSVDASQVEGGRAVGLTRLQIFGRITLPQALRLITLPLTNEWISNFKTATVLSFLGIMEVYLWSSSYISFQLGQPLEGFVMLCIFYLLINVTLSRAVTYIEAKRRIPGLGSLPPEGEDMRRIVGVARGPAKPGGSTPAGPTVPSASRVDGQPLSARARSISDPFRAPDGPA